MNVLILGANGYMGPHVVRKLAPAHQLRITDIRPAPDEIVSEFPKQEFMDIDVTSAEQVRSAAKGMDAIINLSVVRQDPILAFHVNTLGCLHVMRTAVEFGIRRIINTGPHFAIAGPSYEQLDYRISPDIPPHPGTGLYPLSKSLGQEICRTYANQHDIQVLDLLFYSLRDRSELIPDTGGVPFLIEWEDAAEAFRLALEIDSKKLPSRCEVFFVFGDIPQMKFSNKKAKELLGFQPRQDVSVPWKRG